MLNQNVTAQDIQVRQMAEVMGPKSILETSCDSFWSDFRSISDIWWVSVFTNYFSNLDTEK